MSDVPSETPASDHHLAEPSQSPDASPKSEPPGDFSDSVSVRHEIAATLKGILPQDATADAVAAIAVQLVREHSSYEGPMPSGKMLAELRAVDPSFADRAMTFAEKEQAFRHEILRASASQQKAIPFYEFVSRSVGQFCTMLIVAIIVAAVAYLSFHDKNVSAFTPLIYAITGLAAVLVATKTAPDIIKSIRQAMDKKSGESEPEGDGDAESAS